MTNTTIYLDAKDVPAALLGGNTGRKFRLDTCSAVALGSRYWDGGTRSTWRAVRLSDGAAIDMRTIYPGFDSPAHFGGIATDPVVNIPAGVVFVEYSIFCGKDMGLHFYARHEDVATMLPAPAATLTDAERVVLRVTCALKASYNGRNPRIDAALGQWDHERGGLPAITLDEYETAKASLIAAGYLNKAGAVTTKGRNARNA